MVAKSFTIIVEGNIGCGKSTFLNNFQRFKDVETIPEPVKQWKNIDGHNLLDLMYKRSKEWTFPFQTYVGITMMNIHKLETKKDIKIMERSIYSANFCFLEAQRELGNLHPAMYAILKEWYKQIESQVEVDLVLYFRINPEEAFERMKSRGRSEENMVELEYLSMLHELHENWLIRQQEKIPAPLIIVDANQSQDEIFQFVTEKLATNFDCDFQIEKEMKM